MQGLQNDCIFCRIAKGEIPSVKVYETDSVLAFLDVNPIEKGHTLVISKRLHSSTIMDTPEEIAAELLSAVRKIAAAMVASGFGGVNVVQNNLPDGGQAVPHIHFHVIPRAKNRTEPLCWTSGASHYADDTERDAYAARIGNAIG